MDVQSVLGSRLVRGVILVMWVLAGVTSLAIADQEGIVLRRGFFKEIVDANATGFQIQSFRAAGDGSRVAYFGWDGANHALYVVDADGQNNTLVEQSFQMWSLYYGLYDISDDGSTIAYLRLTSAGDQTPEITIYDVATQSKTTALKTVPVSYYGNPETWPIDPQNHAGLFRISGDGSWVFFLNRFGSEIDTVSSSGFTYYRVAANGSGADVMIEDRDIASIPGIGADSISLVAMGGQLSVSEDGSKVAFSTSSSSDDADLVTMNSDGTNANCFADIRDGSFYGPSISADGSTIAYARGGTSTAETTGTFVAQTSAPYTTVQVDPASGYWGVFPHLSSDGEHVVYNFDLGGGSSSSIRYGAADGHLRLPISQPMVQVGHARAMVAEGGTTIFMVARTSRSGLFNLVRFDFNTTPFADIPRVDSVTGQPDLSLSVGQSPFTLLYQTSGPAFREMWSMPFTEDPAQLAVSGFSGFADWGYLYDDGSSDGDSTAGDGIFTDGGIYQSETPTPMSFFMRAGGASDLGVASFADVLVDFGEVYTGLFIDGFESGDESAWQ